MESGILIPFIGYFLIIIGIGVYASRFSSKGINEYFLGGRGMSRFVVALSAVVSGRSAWLLLGVTGLAYVQGISALWAVVGYTVIEFLLFLYYAPRLRDYTEKHDCITIPDFFAARFSDKNGRLRILIVTIFLLFMVAYVSAQFASGGKAFFAHFGIPQNTGLIITAVIVLFYTLLGGFMAVSYTDVLQGIMMVLALLVLPLAGIINAGGWEATMQAIPDAENGFMNMFSIPALSIIGLAGIGLGSPGNPHILVRYMSMKDPAQFRWTAIVGTIWNVIMGLGAVFIGIVGRAYFSEVTLLPGNDSENIFITLANELLPSFLVGLILASVFAAIMSTADSQLLVAASSIVRDIYEKLYKKKQKVEARSLSFLSRIAVVMLVFTAVLLGLYSQELIFWFVLFAWGGLGAAIGPTSIMALFWKRTTKRGVMAGVIAGAASVILWKNVAVLDAMVYELIPGFFISATVTVLVSVWPSKKKA